MSFEFDPIYLIYICVAAAAVLLVEGIYLLCFSGVSYRQNVNRRLKLLKDEPNRENILVQLRRERGLTGGGQASRDDADILRRAVVEVLVAGDRSSLIERLDDSLLGLKPRPRSYFAVQSVAS